MALSGSQKAYLTARSGIARSGAIRSNYLSPLFGVVTVGGVDLTSAIQYASLQVTQQLNEEPDTASFSVFVTSPAVAAALTVGADVLIGLGGARENPLFGGRILTKQTTRGRGGTPAVASVMCADYLQVLDSEYLITYDWPAQSATLTIRELVARFANKPGMVTISAAGVADGLPNHQAFAVVNERYSTVLRRLVTMFPAGGGFYVDPLGTLRVWAGPSEPGVIGPQPLTIGLSTLKAFSETIDASQVRTAVIVEGRRTTAPLGLPAATALPGQSQDPLVTSIPVEDATIFLPATPTEYDEGRIGSQRVLFGDPFGVWSAPADTPQSTVTTQPVAFAPGPGSVLIYVASTALVTGRNYAWVQIDDQYLRVQAGAVGATVWLEAQRSGFGGMTGPIALGALVKNVDYIDLISPTRRYMIGPELNFQWEPIRAQPIDSDVVMVARSATGSGALEHLVQDGRYTREGAAARGQQELTDFSAALTSVEFETEDLYAKPGRLVHYNFTATPAMSGDLMILSAEISWPVWGQVPRVRCRAANIRAANVVDTWVTDSR